MVLYRKKGMRGFMAKPQCFRVDQSGAKRLESYFQCSQPGYTSDQAIVNPQKSPRGTGGNKTTKNKLSYREDVGRIGSEGWQRQIGMSGPVGNGDPVN